MLLQIERIQQGSALSQRVAPDYQEFVAFRRLTERDLAQSRSVQYYARQLAPYSYCWRDGDLIE